MLKKWNNWCVYLLLQFLIWKAIFYFPTVSNVIFKSFTLNYNRFIYAISSQFDFPIGEVFYGVMFLILVGIIAKIITKKNSFQIKLFKISKVLFFVYMMYNLVWGIAYYKTSFNIELSQHTIDQEKLKAIYCEELEQAENLRNRLNEALERSTQFKLKNQDYLNDFKVNQMLLKQENWIQNYTLIENPVVKHANISRIMNHIGILGYYNPFTIESNVNIYNTDLKSPYTIAHELGHQMGFASENEANFIAYFIGIHSEFDEVRYATYFKSIYSILGNIIQYDPLFVKAQLEGMPQGIKTDRKVEIEYYQQFDGKASDTFSAMNNQFLKVNNQEGTVSYSKYVELMYYYKIKKANP